MSTDLQVIEQRPLTVAEIQGAKDRISMVLQNIMKEGHHYGKIPGTENKSLLKPGAEVILSTFRIAVTPIVEDLSTYDSFRYRVAARGMLPDGTIVGAGIGEASTDEEKYKWRGAICDEEFEATPSDRRRIKYKKYGDRVTEVQQVRTNPADLANTVLKMAKKRAMVDLCLTSTGCSDIFTQDIEDMPEEVRAEIIGDEKRIRGGKKKGGKPEVKGPQSTDQGGEGSGDADVISDGQRKMVYAKMKAAGVEESDLIAWMASNGHAGSKLSEIKKASLTAIATALDGGAVKRGTLV